MVDSEKVIVAGDFNAILNNVEKYGGLRMNAHVMEDFRDFVTDNNLFDVIPKSGNFTWTNRRANFSRILERLDRIFSGTYWIRGQFDLETTILPLTLSDHFLVQLNCITSMAKNIFSEKMRVEVELDRLNKVVIENGMSNEESNTENSLKAELAEILLREEMFWRDKSRELWIEVGDSISKFFHASLKAKRNKNIINHLTDDSGRLVGKERSWNA
ncbi:uncharacterized protein LOC131876609 [Cryptomeria japonica]|uniref:uncharacterized protein LOC131876609 n=1 Tax=Cryptomeria japonica TaxID=3369 RepID=UPI0027D9F67D|nr:uncharacterized protein LOC131876609 [Cryptomeria japonica]